MKRFFREYLSMLKPLPIEGLPDLLIFRPIAFILVKILARLPVTPNQVSITAIITGIGSGICFSRGTPEAFLWAGLLYGATAVIDCSDGMLARYKKSGTPIGRIIDGTIDYTNGIAIFSGLGIGMSKMSGIPNEYLWIIILVAALSMTLQSIIIDHYRNQFFVYALNVKQSVDMEIKTLSSELACLKEANIKPVTRLLIKLYLAYCHIQKKTTRPAIQYDAAKYYRVNRLTLRLWQVIELSAHICVLMVAAILYRPQIFLVYTIIIANLWILLMIPIQRTANRKSL